MISTRIAGEVAVFHNRLNAVDAFALERLHRRRQLRDEMGDGDQREISIPIWLIGDSVIVALPVEAYSDFQHFSHSKCSNINADEDSRGIVGNNHNIIEHCPIKTAIGPSNTSAHRNAVEFCGSSMN